MSHILNLLNQKMHDVMKDPSHRKLIKLNARTLINRGFHLSQALQSEVLGYEVQRAWIVFLHGVLITFGSDKLL